MAGGALTTDNAPIVANALVMAAFVASWIININGTLSPS